MNVTRKDRARPWALGLLVLAALAPPVWAADLPAEKRFRDEVQPLLAKHTPCERGKRTRFKPNDRLLMAYRPRRRQSAAKQA